MARILLVIFLLAYFASAENKWYGPDTFGTKTIRNDRGVTIQKDGQVLRRPNRNFSNAIQMGLLEGMMKVSTGGKVDCLDEGMTILRGLVRLIYKLNFTADDHTDMDARNIVEMIVVLTMRCNYHSTI